MQHHLLRSQQDSEEDCHPLNGNLVPLDVWLAEPKVVGPDATSVAEASSIIPKYSFIFFINNYIWIKMQKQNI